MQRVQRIRVSRAIESIFVTLVVVVGISHPRISLAQAEAATADLDFKKRVEIQKTASGFAFFECVEAQCKALLPKKEFSLAELKAIQKKVEEAQPEQPLPQLFFDLVSNLQSPGVKKTTQVLAMAVDSQNTPGLVLFDIEPKQKISALIGSHNKTVTLPKQPLPYTMYKVCHEPTCRPFTGPFSSGVSLDRATRLLKQQLQGG